MKEEEALALARILTQYFSYEELRMLVFTLGIEWDALRGDSKDSKIRELLTYAERRGRLEELVELIREMRPHVTEFPKFDVSTKLLLSQSAHSDADILRMELTELRQELEEIQQEALTDEQLDQRLEEMTRTASRAIGRSGELTSRLLLPPPELTDQPLLPWGTLERLEEYRSDENVAYLLLGAFVGAVLGILSNWATNEALVITRASIILQVLFVVLAIVCILWIRRLRQRAARITESVRAMVKSHQESKGE